MVYLGRGGFPYPLNVVVDNDIMLQTNSEIAAVLDMLVDVVSATPDSVNPLARAEDSLAMMGHAEGAEELVKRAIKERDSALWRLLFARQLNRKGKAKQAGTEINKALKLDNAWYPGHCEKALHLIRQGKIAKASEAASRAVEINPNFPDGYMVLGAAAFLQRHFDEAMQAFRRLTELCPDTVDGHYFLGRALLMAGNPSDARECFQRAQRSGTYGYRALIWSGKLAEHDKDTVSALSAYLDASRMQPENPFPLVHLSLISSKAGLVDKGIEYAKQVQELVPETVTLTLAKAYSYAHSGQIDRAMNIQRELTVKHEDVRQGIAFISATQLMKENKLDRCEKIICEELARTPASVDFMFQQARLEMLRKDYDRAADRFSQLVDLHPDEGLYVYMRVQALLRGGNYEKALEVVEDIPPEHSGREILRRRILELQKAPSPKAPEEPASAKVGEEPVSAKAEEDFANENMSEDLADEEESEVLTNAPEVDVQEVFRFRYDMAEAAKYMPAQLQIYNHFSAIVAYVIRETKGRYVNQKMGYFAAIIETAVTMLVLLLIFKFIRNKQPGGMSLEEFLLTGLMMLNFVTMPMTSIGGCIKRKRKLLMAPQITSFTLRIGEAFISSITNTFVVFCLALGFYMFGIEIMVVDLPQVFLAVLLAVLLGAAIGIIIECLMTVWELAKLLKPVINRVLFFTSGVFFSVNDMPEIVQKYALVNPLMHLIEFTRNGFQTTYPMQGVSFTYAIAVTGGLLLLAFLLDMRLRDMGLAR